MKKAPKRALTLTIATNQVGEPALEASVGYTEGAAEHVVQGEVVSDGLPCFALLAKVGPVYVLF